MTPRDFLFSVMFDKSGRKYVFCSVCQNSVIKCMIICCISEVNMFHFILVNSVYHLICAKLYNNIISSSFDSIWIVIHPEGI